MLDCMEERRTHKCILSFTGTWGIREENQVGYSLWGETYSWGQAETKYTQPPKMTVSRGQHSFSAVQVLCVLKRLTTLSLSRYMMNENGKGGRDGKRGLE